MKAHWWSFVLGLLCLPAEVTLNTWTASQDPSSMSVIQVNSSTAITCSTTLPNPMGLYLQRRFHDTKDVLYLSLENRQITKNTTDEIFEGRIQITPEQQRSDGSCSFTLVLSALGFEDTDLYYCRWIYFASDKKGDLSSRGTIIIVREKIHEEQCGFHFMDLILITLSVIAFTMIVFLAAGELIIRCKRFKKDLWPSRVEAASAPNESEPVYHQQRAQQCPYIFTFENTPDFINIL